MFYYHCSVDFAETPGAPMPQARVGLRDTRPASALKTRFGFACARSLRSVLSPTWRRTALGIESFAPRWTLPNLAERNPLVWMAEVNALVVDLRNQNL